MCLTVESKYEQNQVITNCAICGRGARGRFTPPVRFILFDNDEQLGDLCERCAFGPAELWRIALTDHANRLELKAAVLRDLAGRAHEAEPAQEGVIEDLLREAAHRPRPGRPPFQPPR